MTMKLIGKGSFTKAYLQDNGKVLLKSVDPIKECMAFGWFPEHRLFPAVEQIDTGMYEMQYYPKVASLKQNLTAEDWALYKELKALFDAYQAPSNKYDGYSTWYTAFADSDLPEEIKEVLLGALDACSNMGPDIMFEISPRNVAVDNGRLVLLDCFFQTSMLQKVRNSK